MKLVVKQEDLAHALGAAGRSVAVRTTLPALTGIYLQAADETLIVRATNLEMGLECTIPADVERTGAIVLPARHLTEMVRRVPAGAVEVEVSPDALRAEVRWGRSRFTIHGFSPDDFPVLPEPAGYGGLPFSQAAMKRAIRQTVFCVSTDPSRNFLTGVSFTFGDDTVKAVSTDGYRIAIKECRLTPDGDDDADHDVEAIEVPSTSAAEADEPESQSLLLDMDDSTGLPVPADTPFKGRDLVIPAASLTELARNLSDHAREQGILYLVDKDACFDLGQVKFNARLIEGRFPNVLAIVPSSYVTTINIGVDELLAACERVLLVAQGQDRTLAARIRMERELLVINSDRPDLGRAHEEIEAQIEGELLQVYFNPRFLIEGLRHQEGQRCVLELSGTETPGRMTVPGSDFQYVVMPVKVG